MVNTCFSKRVAKMKRLLSLSCCLLAGLLLAGCGQPPAEESRRVVAMALTDLQGVEHSLADYRGKWVIVNYWATWCPPCLEELPELERFHNRHKERAAVVWGVNREDISREDLQAFVEAQRISYPLFQIPADAPSPLGPVRGIPTTYLVSPEGEVVARHVGLVTARKLERFLQRHRNK